MDPGNTELHILWYTYDDAGRLSAIHLDEGTASTTSPTNSSRLIRSYAYNAYGEIEKITDNTSFLTGGTLTTELAYTYNDYGLPVKLTYTDVDGETSTVCEETHLTYDGNGNILAEAVTEAYSGSTTRTRTYQYDLGQPPDLGHVRRDGHDVYVRRGGEPADAAGGDGDGGDVYVQLPEPADAGAAGGRR